MISVTCQHDYFACWHIHIAYQHTVDKKEVACNWLIDRIVFYAASQYLNYVTTCHMLIYILVILYLACIACRTALKQRVVLLIIYFENILDYNLFCQYGFLLFQCKLVRKNFEIRRLNNPRTNSRNNFTMADRIWWCFFFKGFVMKSVNFVLRLCLEAGEIPARPRHFWSHRTLVPVCEFSLRYYVFKVEVSHIGEDFTLK